MEFSLLETLRHQPTWVQLLLSLGFLHFSRLSFSFLKWIYIFFLRQPKNLLDYGRWAIVTGPTDGIGKAMAFELVRRGLNLILVGRNPEKLKQVTGELRAEVPTVELVSIAIECLDVGILVNNAAASYAVPKCLHEVDEGMFTELVKVNMDALTEITRVVLLRMLKKKKGAIVNVGSGSSVIAPSYPCLLFMPVPKRDYVDQLSRSLHHEYKEKGIDVQCQVPSYIVTKMVPDIRRSFFNSAPEEYALPAVRAIGFGTTVLPYWRHSMQCYFAKLARRASLMNGYYVLPLREENSIQLKA
ncbi:unnamed protein product [Spirodela intermedia]|uniref:Uncharacterized protein n=1 Tax=Spirodela intermedia TaxID=51605 RepID=A0A7I8JDK1_SPIIN|nr:unnamed protein product [Spirodela intermedia]CAA6668238.1 unnamed protein product [Spirodela intermedia]